MKDVMTDTMKNTMKDTTKVTNLVLINMFNVLDNYAKKKFPQRISYAITRNIMIMSKEYEIYDKQRQKLFGEYADYMIKDEKGNPKVNEIGLPIVKESVREEFNGQMADLLNIEIDLNLYTIDPDFFDYDDKGSYDPMSAKDIITLQSILCKKEDESGENGTK